jgi:mRNA deadenylase 3'-5' endonuclease subunit Ccr4
MKITTRRLISLSSIFGSLDAILPKQFGWTTYATAMAPLSQQLEEPLNVRVASYNVLSSHLSGKDHYSTLNPEHLRPKNRLPVVLQKIDEEIERSAIICLQEVSHDWAGTFHTHFANKGYHLVTGLYGKKFNGYMGVAIAFKTESFDVLGVDVSRLADKREGGWPRKPKEPERNVVARFAINSYGFAKTTTKSFLGLLGLYNAPRWPPQDAWAMSENRFNQLVTVKLQDKATQKSFAVGTYHMPCAFYKPQVMTIHTDLAARHVQKMVTSVPPTQETTDGCDITENENEQPGTVMMPYVLAGDWNIKPDGSSYRLLTTGKMDKGELFFQCHSLMLDVVVYLIRRLSRF